MNKVSKLVSILTARPYLSAMALHHVAAAVEHTSVLTALDCRTVVDIGANRGQFALVARRCFPGADIISFEPLPEPAAVFRRVFARDNATVLHEAAIGPAPEHGTMHVSAQDDSSSLLPISSLQREIFPGTDEIATVNVRVAPLDTFLAEDDIRGPALLKLDVQGFELDALRGCESLLPRFNWVYCECSFVELYSGQKQAADVVDWLSTKGFRLKGTYNPSYDNVGKSVQADFLFRREGEVGIS